jgi:hypothetical protein
MPQYAVDSRTVENIIGYIKAGEIAIPEIQRPFVWDGSKIRDLIDSLYHGYPVGYLIIWQNPDMRDKSGNLTIGKKIMIDGQQRVTALMTAVVGMKVLDKDFNEKVYKIAFNPFAQAGENSFEVQSAAIQKDKRWIPDISELFKPDFESWTFVNNYCEANSEIKPNELSKLIQDVIKIKNAPIGVINLNNNLSIDEVTEIFIRINSQGKTLTQADFVMSTIAANEVNGGNILRKAIDYFCHLSNNHDFMKQIEKDDNFTVSDYYPSVKWITNYNGNIITPTFDDLIRVAFMTQYYRAKLANLCDLLHGRNFETRTYENSILENSFKLFSDGVRSFINQYNLQQLNEIIKSAGFVLTKLLRGRMALDFAYMLYIRLRNDKNIDKVKIPQYVQKWYVMSVLTGRYIGSPETQMERDLRAIENRSFVRFFDDTMANLGDDFWNVTLPQTLESSSTASPTFLVYQAAQCRGKDDSFLGKGSCVRDLIESGDIHHIFPKNYLQKNGINQKIMYNQIANYVVLNKTINIAIGDKAPSDYLKVVKESCEQGSSSKYSVISSIEKLQENLHANSIPDSLATMDFNDYDSFLQKRRILMAQKIRDYFYSL